tara:strand:- start:56 stop:217 length:162 start_codon:yes stop_codon:yes gene_type:complete
MKLRALVVFMLPILFISCATSGKKVSTDSEGKKAYHERIYDIPPYMDFRGDRR